MAVQGGGLVVSAVAADPSTPAQKTNFGRDVTNGPKSSMGLMVFCCCHFLCFCWCLPFKLSYIVAIVALTFGGVYDPLPPPLPRKNNSKIIKDDLLLF